MGCNYYIFLLLKENINIVMNSRTRYGGKVLEKENHMEDLGVDGKIVLQ